MPLRREDETGLPGQAGGVAFPVRVTAARLDGKAIRLAMLE